MPQPKRSEWDPIDSLGQTGTVVARNIKQLRNQKGLTYKDLSDRLNELRRPIPTLGLRKIESGGRRVDADDLVALAVALEVSPITLLMPPAPQRSTRVPVTGEDDLIAGEALWDWLLAEKPLPGMTTKIGTFLDNAQPLWYGEEFKATVDEVRKAMRDRGDDQ